MNFNLKQVSLALSLFGIRSSIACLSMEQGTGQKVNTTLKPKSGSQVKGNVIFTWQGSDVLINGKFSGLNLDQGIQGIL